MAEEKDDSQEKTEQASQKRLEESKQKGQVSRSRELSTMTLMVLGSASLFFLGHSMVNSILNIMRDNFVLSRADIFDRNIPSISLIQACVDAIQSLSPLFIVLFLVALVSPLAVGGWVFSAESLAFKWEKLDPIKGMKRVFGARGVMELLKALAKFSLLSGLAVLLIWVKFDELLVLGRNDLRSGLIDATYLIVWAFLLLSSATILIAAVDVPFQLWEHARQLKMTKQEVRDELKETEGKPEVKSHIRAMQQQLANRRMLEDVPKADVIITNPTHYAIALIYDQENMGAPRLVAKGMDYVALHIRSVASNHNVAIFSAPMLARALYYNTKIGQEIPAGLYLAVAQVLAYVFQLREYRTNPHIEWPNKPSDIPVPEEFRTET